MGYEDLKREVLSAVSEGQMLRSAFYLAMGEPDEQVLNESAKTEDLAALQARLGAPIPPSYRAFVEAHDGWKMFDAAADLYTIQDALAKDVSPAMEKWRKVAREVEGIETKHWLMIGGSKFSAIKYFLDPGRISGDGEMICIEHDKAIESEYSSFLEMLREQNDVYSQGVKDIDGGYDFSNV